MDIVDERNEFFLNIRISSERHGEKTFARRKRVASSKNEFYMNDIRTAAR